MDIPEPEQEFMIASHPTVMQREIESNCKGKSNTSSDHSENPVASDIHDDGYNSLVGQLELPAARIGVVTILKALLDRLATLSSMPEAHDMSDTSIKIDDHSEHYDLAKSRLLENAKFALNPATQKSKLSKFMLESSWLQRVLRSTMEEVQNKASFSSLSKVIEHEDAKAKRIHEGVEHMKSLKSEMRILRHLLRSESVYHDHLIEERHATNLRLRQAIKDLKKENKITNKFRLDISVATNDCRRRIHDERLKALKDRVNHLGNRIEMEKKANKVCAEFLKKQSIEFMEAAISLTAARDNDVQCMDMMLLRLKQQKQRKEKLLQVLEPRYKEEMAQKKADLEAELARQQEISIQEQGQLQVTTRAALKIQKIWRGRSVRLLYSKELKKKLKNKKVSKSKVGEKQKQQK